MKKAILNRYERTEKGEVIIDASVRSVEDLYNNFDRTAPYLKKDLDQEFVDYVIECVREIGKADFVIRISLLNMPDEAVMGRVRKSIQTYFHYLQETERRSLAAMFRRSFVLFLIGLTLLALAIMATRRFSPHEGVWAEVFAQGLTVAAWVSLWEAIANLFVEWFPHRQDIRRHVKVMNAPVMFRPSTR
ncbi:MAG: hypothetical protein P8Z79_08215 [Sedimentisphaerales bacterium]|jgi:hypothetical protein